MLFSSFNNTDTHLAKERGWQQIVEEVNAVSQVKRSKEEIKRKWTCIKSETKKKNSQHKRSLNKTGGGPVDLSNDPDETERVVLGILGPTAINGISGGIETTDLPNVNERGGEIRLLQWFNIPLGHFLFINLFNFPIISKSEANWFCINKYKF